MHQEEQNHHIPVLLSEVLQYLRPTKGESYLDLTGGYGGHAGAVLERTQNPEGTTLVDRDANAITALKERFGKVSDIRQADFLTASQQLIQEGKRFDMILADLGVSSPHLNQASRGFAFSQNGPLDMRMDQSQELTAEKVVNTYPEKELAKIIKQYGEDPKARQIAARIVRSRPLKTTQELAKVVAGAWPGHSKTHPASRTFQALRIVVNDELVLIEKSVPLWIKMLKPGGRLAIISFHSLEDRIVKQILADQAGDRYDAELTLLTKKPASASSDEIVFNPRARSAKLRAAVKK